MSNVQKQAVLDLVRLSEEMDLYYMEFDRYESRPWGYFVILEEHDTHKIKRIVVFPGGKLSYQMHRQRNEAWTVVRGCGSVVIDDVVQHVGPGSVVQIPAGRKHRVLNEGTEELQFIEVQTGTYFGEDDIVRFSDEYGRV